MSLIDKEVSDFKVKAYHNEEIIDVELKDIKGKWSTNNHTIRRRKS